MILIRLFLTFSLLVSISFAFKLYRRKVIGNENQTDDLTDGYDASDSSGKSTLIFEGQNDGITVSVVSPFSIDDLIRAALDASDENDDGDDKNLESSKTVEFKKRDKIIDEMDDGKSKIIRINDDKDEFYKSSSGFNRKPLDTDREIDGISEIKIKTPSSLISNESADDAELSMANNSSQKETDEENLRTTIKPDDYESHIMSINISSNYKIDESTKGQNNMNKIKRDWRNFVKKEQVENKIIERPMPGLGGVLDGNVTIELPILGHVPQKGSSSTLVLNNRSSFNEESSVNDKEDDGVNFKESVVQVGSDSRQSSNPNFSVNDSKNEGIDLKASAIPIRIDSIPSSNPNSSVNDSKNEGIDLKASAISIRIDSRPSSNPNSNESSLNDFSNKRNEFESSTIPFKIDSNVKSSIPNNFTAIYGSIEGGISLNLSSAFNSRTDDDKPKSINTNYSIISNDDKVKRIIESIDSVENHRGETHDNNEFGFNSGKYNFTDDVNISISDKMVNEFLNSTLINREFSKVGNQSQIQKIGLTPDSFNQASVSPLSDDNFDMTLSKMFDSYDGRSNLSNGSATTDYIGTSEVEKQIFKNHSQNGSAQEILYLKQREHEHQFEVDTLNNNRERNYTEVLLPNSRSMQENVHDGVLGQILKNREPNYTLTDFSSTPEKGILNHFETLYNRSSVDRETSSEMNRTFSPKWQLEVSNESGYSSEESSSIDSDDIYQKSRQFRPNSRTFIMKILNNNNKTILVRPIANERQNSGDLKRFNTTNYSTILEQSHSNRTNFSENPSLNTNDDGRSEPLLVNPLNPSTATWTWRQVFTVCCIIVSVPFLAVTFIVFWVLPQLNQSDHGKSIMRYIMSVMIGYTTLAVTLIFGQSLGPMCAPLGYLLHFCILAINCWLNVMCFDVFFAFRVLEKRAELPSRFSRYSLYSWGLPAVIVLSTFLISYAPLPDKYRPNVGGDMCFLQDELTQWIYCHGPASIFTLANIIMFVGTVYVIVKHTSDTKVLSSPDSARTRAQRRWFRLYTKLFVVMGMNWVAELLSLFLDFGNASFIFLITDTTNSLLGVIIFLIYVCRRRVVNQLKKWWKGEDMIAGRKRSTFASTLTRFRESLVRSKFGSSFLGFTDEKNL